MEARPEFTVIAGPNGATKHEVTNHGIKWFNMFFADCFKNL